jgi:hypothetical protein
VIRTPIYGSQKALLNLEEISIVFQSVDPLAYKLRAGTPGQCLAFDIRHLTFGSLEASTLRRDSG